MESGEIIGARIICQGCEFVAEVAPTDSDHPIDVMNKHKQETGHELRMEGLEE